jgi:hypothetical protein
MRYLDLDMEHLISSPLMHRLLSWLAVISILTFVLSLLLIPFIVGCLSPDYFLQLGVKKKGGRSFSPLAVIWLVGRNILGFVLLLAGLAMLFLPGQGLLTILISILLLSLPGKDRLINRLTSLDSVRRSLDWLRRKKGKVPFIWQLPENETAP